MTTMERVSARAEDLLEHAIINTWRIKNTVEMKSQM